MGKWKACLKILARVVFETRSSQLATSNFFWSVTVRLDHVSWPPWKCYNLCLWDRVISADHLNIFWAVPSPKSIFSWYFWASWCYHSPDEIIVGPHPPCGDFKGQYYVGSSFSVENWKRLIPDIMHRVVEQLSSRISNLYDHWYHDKIFI